MAEFLEVIRGFSLCSAEVWNLSRRKRRKSAPKQTGGSAVVGKRYNSSSRRGFRLGLGVPLRFNCLLLGLILG